AGGLDRGDDGLGVLAGGVEQAAGLDEIGGRAAGLHEAGLGVVVVQERRVLLGEILLGDPLLRRRFLLLQLLVGHAGQPNQPLRTPRAAAPPTPPPPPRHGPRRRARPAGPRPASPARGGGPRPRGGGSPRRACPRPPGPASRRRSAGSGPRPSRPDRPRPAS